MGIHTHLQDRGLEIIGNKLETVITRQNQLDKATWSNRIASGEQPTEIGVVIVKGWLKIQQALLERFQEYLTPEAQLPALQATRELGEGTTGVTK